MKLIGSRTLAPGFLVTLASILLAACVWASEETRVAGVSDEPGDARLEESENHAALSGQEIYRRMLANKYRRGIQNVEIVSSDPGGSEQTTVFTASLEDHRGEEDQPIDGKNASLLIEITRPFDMRHTRYLMVAKEPGPDDEFIYRPSNRLVKRVDLKQTPLMGTDYTFNDLAYHDIDGATYNRLPDEVLGGVPVFVIEATVTDTRASQNHRSISYIERLHFIPIRVRYWDRYDVEIKELTADPSSIRLFGETWIATRSAMRDLLQGTTSRSSLLSLDTEPTFSKMHFSTRRLAQGN
jgi:hypothetical protein